MTKSGIKSGIKINVENYRNKIRLRWSVSRVRYSLQLDLIYNFEGLKRADLVSSGIISDIERGNFDSTLLKYKPEKVIEPLKLLSEYKKWVVNQGFELEKNSTHYQIYKMISSWGDFRFQDLEDLLNNSPCNSTTYNIRLRILNKFFSWLIRTKKISVNPCASIEKKSPRKSSCKQREPLSGEDIEKILEAVKNDTYSSKHSTVPHSYYYPFLYFISRTGVRNQEAVGLKVKYIDLKKGIITIAEVLAMYAGKPYKRYWKDTKNYKVREIPLSDDLRDILLPQITGKEPEDLVFPSPRGSFINDRNFQDRVFKPILKGLGLQDKHLYALRHSFASRALEQGLNILSTSYLMGNNPDTMLKHYAKLINKPKSLPDLD